LFQSSTFLLQLNLVIRSTYLAMLAYHVSIQVYLFLAATYIGSHILKGDTTKL
jgi:hypothetical protein